MSDSIQTYPRFSGNALRVPAEVKGLLLLLSAKGVYQKGVLGKLHQLLEYFWKDLIIFDHAHVFYNAGQPFQIEWLLRDSRDNAVGTLVFGRKLPTTYGQAPLRKFWIRRDSNAEFGVLAASVLVNTELFDYLYCHDHDESIRLNKYSQGDGDIVYRNESVGNKNPNWHYLPVSVEEPEAHTKERRAPLFGSGRGQISISDNFDDPIDDFED
ncbi:hypothetical protein QT972_28985 [Microcoleus sp. herbarium7]|uniref:hypothetical protein n=1 Tax=Microcoleus sp. herbarium7 TaxID=3055435 RepID=UPI002FD178E5